jgi:hypothetical protein
LYRERAPDRLISECARIAKECELSETHRANDLSKALRILGGFITNEYNERYFKESIANGATLAISYNSEGAIETFALYYPAGSVPAELFTLHPELEEYSAGYYDLLCSARGASPDASVALNRAIFVTLQHSRTGSVIAINHESNEPAIRASLGMGDRIGGSSTVVRTLNGVTTKYLQISAPVSAHEREQELPGAAVTRARQNVVIQRVRERINPASWGTVSYPTPDELAQMRQLSAAYADKRFYRLSLGVASMTPEAAAKLKGLVARGFFDSLDGLVVVGAGRLAEKRADDWIIRDGDALSTVSAIRERNPRAIPVGMAPYNVAEPSHGLSQKVISPDGVEREMAVLLSEQAQQISVADHSQSLVIKNPVSIDRASEDNLDVWHVEALRAMTLAGHFSEPTFIFGAGGGVIAWEIKTVLKAITDGQLPSGRVVFLKGLGGATDKLADDPEIAQIAGEYKTNTGQDLVTIVDVDSDPQELREALPHVTTAHQSAQ